jgi:hypothetical protein
VGNHFLRVDRAADTMLHLFPVCESS